MSSKNGEIFQISKLSLFGNMTQNKYQMLLESSGIWCYLCKDGLLNMKITCFALSLEELNCLHPMNYIKFAARLSDCGTKKSVLSFMMPHMLL